MQVDPRHPHQLAFRDYTVLVAHPDGQITGDDGCGLLDHDCRILSRHRLTIDGRLAGCTASGADQADAWFALLHLSTGSPTPEGPMLPQDDLEIRIERRVGAGMLERLAVRNHSMAPRDVSLQIELDADFADVQELAGDRRQQGTTHVSWDQAQRALTWHYSVERERRADERGTRVRILRSDSPPRREATRLSFDVDLAPGGLWSATLAVESRFRGQWLGPALDHDEAPARASVGAIPAFEQAASDLYALRNRDLERGDGWVVNAGVPTFTGLFGRDLLTAGWQSAMAWPQIMLGGLSAIAATQATRDDPWRDAEPGKLVHEMRVGPLSELDVIPQSAYYGTQTTSALFPLILSELWHWTGDTDALRGHRAVAERALAWARETGDLDGDGFLEYRRRSPEGLKNHAWKDSDEAIRYPDGSIVDNPIATVEEQAFHFVALCRMAEICVALEDDEAADRYLDQARHLRAAFQRAFWVEEIGFYALALDSSKNPVATIASNPGHALAAGIVPGELARRVADRLMADDMFSGWGIRTLSSGHPSFNPWAYHLGTVWPVENATFALGFKRYGLDGHAARLAGAMLDAAARFAESRLPEALGGQPRDRAPFPSAYPASNVPQAWSASATIQLVQVMLGIYPFAPAGVLALVRPALPEWLPAVEVRDLRVGGARVSLRFTRNADGTADHEVTDRHGALFVVSAPPPNDPDPGMADRAFEWLLEHAPGRMARAARIGLGLIDD
ncbi:MAG TPA: glycogen debranching N-terminal domain-containing protein [Candidatus Limnocylindria bacterium]|nr:glycogen debranching N-terminal domain-containing protein [Candidatus Limnocylindria bacterium]